MPDPTTEELVADIHQRFAAIESAASPATIQEIITTYLSGLADTDPFIRKMRFGDAEPKLIGSKFARWNYTQADIEWLYDYMNGRSRIGFNGPSEDLTKAFNTVSDAYYMTEEEARKIDQTAIDGVYSRLPKQAFFGRDRALASKGRWEETAAYKRAMDTAETGFGLELIGAQYVGNLWDVSRELGVIAPLISTFEMTAPVAYLPVEAGFPELLYVAESTANNSSNYTTVKTGSNRVSATAKKFVLHQMWSGEMEEDSIIPFVPFLRQEAARSLAFYLDSAYLNGDTTNAGTGNINLDDADPADTKHYLAYDGIRHGAIVDNTANALNVGATLTLDTFRALRALMRDTTRFVDWGHPVNRNDLVFIADPDTADRIDLLDDVVNAKLMSGNSADLLNGQTAQIIGHPVIRTMVMSKTEADGKVSTTGSNNTLGQLTALNRTGCVAGWRRQVKQEVERIPATDQTRIVYSLRNAFARFTPTGNVNAIEWTATAYNIAV